MHGAIKALPLHGEPTVDVFDPPYEIVRPAAITSPVVFASPHSGRVYPAAFLAASRLDATTLRASEDAYVDELFSSAPASGAPLIAARFPRAFLDVNRDPWELDPSMFHEPLPAWAKTRTPRVAAGLGAVPRIVADGAEIYAHPIPVRDAEARVRDLHHPYHRALDRLVGEVRNRFGGVLLVDCHSMPSVGGPGERDSGRGRVDVVIGDRFGSACAFGVTRALEASFRARGFRVARNTPYAGGWTTERHGRPARGRHAVQIELNRALYLDEARVERSANFETVRAQICDIIGELLAQAAALVTRR